MKSINLGFTAMRDGLAKTGRPIVYSTEWDVVYVQVNGQYNQTVWNTVIFIKS